MSFTKRQSAGQKTGVVSMLINFGLFVGKLFAGLLSNSIAIMADSFNSLADCGTSLATILGFRFGSRHADDGHPFGHGRMEYVAGLVVSIMIFVTAYSVGAMAVGRIFAKEEINFSWISAAICVVAIIAKICLALYIRHRNRKIDSQTLNASFWDSITDVFATAIALLSLILAPLINFPLDGFLGLIVALFITYAGIRAFWMNLNLILGQGLSKREYSEICDIVREFKAFNTVSALYVHDYGPESRILIIKVHLSEGLKAEQIENQMNECKKVLCDKFNFSEVVIYWPPTIHE